VLASSPDHFNVPRESPNATLRIPRLSPIQRALPERAIALQLIRTYFSASASHDPILHLPTVLEMYEGVEAQDEGIDSKPREKFILFMIMAIVVAGVTDWRSVGIRPSDDYFAAAMIYAEHALASHNDSFNVLQAVLLLCQYILYVPSAGSLLYLCSFACTICVDIGLHRESERSNRTPPTVHSECRRRAFWAAYVLERSVATTLGRPSTIPDSAINATLPLAITDASLGTSLAPIPCPIRRLHLHRIEIWRLQSEIKHILYDHHPAGSNVFAYVRPATPSLDLWYPDITARLDAWASAIPPNVPGGFATAEWWGANLYYTRIILHRPSTRNPVPTDQSMRVLLSAAVSLVKTYKVLCFETGGINTSRIYAPWLSAHKVFAAGIAGIYILWTRPELVAEVAGIEPSVWISETCSVLSSLATSFPPAERCRHLFDSMSLATLRRLSTSTQVISAAEQHHEIGRGFGSDSNLASLVRMSSDEFGDWLFTAPNDYTSEMLGAAFSNWYDAYDLRT
jgi:hypothetical protein